MDEYAELAAAVIEQSARDYYDITKLLPQLTEKQSKRKVKQLRKIIDFFRSEWYYDLSSLCCFRISGIELMKILNNNIKNGIPMGKKQYF